MAEQVIDGLMVKFRGFTKKITEKLSGILRSPEERERNKEPIKRSIIQELQDAKKRSEAEREARKNNPELQRLKPKRKDDIER